MADAKICDRCGEYYAPVDDSPGLYVTDNPCVTVTVTEDELNRLPRGGAAAVRTAPHSKTKNAPVEAKDLCEDCQQALEEFWNSGGEDSE